MTDYETSNKKNFSKLYFALDTVQEYLNKFVQVEKFEFTIPSNTGCGDISSVAENITKAHSETDLIILVMPVNSEKNLGMASKGKVCYFDNAHHNRPVLGRMDINYQE